ncbi:hypothetical protein AJ80_06235 [Polytolypa hystricis UAMH7299]|uniref:Uncharacterized protein n=1 Tax=Polytolypa hystricis (strain UAMH7299) TaxID=1447883 RepID=A0A2B7XXH9_POLH7|nr:hypothetical protein AJ80_06235 [Polytolypa hystricis UAMH7299]
MSVENGKTGLKFFKVDTRCKVASGDLAVYELAKGVEDLSYSTDFYAELKANLSPKKLRRVVEELAHIQRPMEGQCPGFRNIKIVLLDSLPPRKVKAWRFPKGESPVTSQLELKFRNEVEKNKNVHAEMMLMTYLLGSRRPSSEGFPYLGVSKKTCLLCGYILREMGRFETRGNHGKCYSR